MNPAPALHLLQILQEARRVSVPVGCICRLLHVIDVAEGPVQGCITRASQHCLHRPLLQVFEEGGGAYTKAGTWTIHENEAAMIEAEADADEAWEEALREKAEWTLKPTPSPITTPSKGTWGGKLRGPQSCSCQAQASLCQVALKWHDAEAGLQSSLQKLCWDSARPSTKLKFCIPPPRASLAAQLSTCRAIGRHVPVSVVCIWAAGALFALCKIAAGSLMLRTSREQAQGSWCLCQAGQQCTLLCAALKAKMDQQGIDFEAWRADKEAFGLADEDLFEHFVDFDDDLEALEQSLIKAGVDVDKWVEGTQPLVDALREAGVDPEKWAQGLEDYRLEEVSLAAAQADAWSSSTMLARQRSLQSGGSLEKFWLDWRLPEWWHLQAG